MVHRRGQAYAARAAGQPELPYLAIVLKDLMAVHVRCKRDVSLLRIRGAAPLLLGHTRATACGATASGPAAHRTHPSHHHQAWAAACPLKVDPAVVQPLLAVTRIAVDENELYRLSLEAEGRRTSHSRNGSSLAAESESPALPRPRLLSFGGLEVGARLPSAVRGHC